MLNWLTTDLQVSRVNCVGMAIEYRPNRGPLGLRSILGFEIDPSSVPAQSEGRDAYLTIVEPPYVAAVGRDSGESREGMKSSGYIYCTN